MHSFCAYSKAADVQYSVLPRLSVARGGNAAAVVHCRSYICAECFEHVCQLYCLLERLLLVTVCMCRVMNVTAFDYTVLWLN